MGALGVVELQRVRDGVEHAVRNTLEVAAFELHVVVDAEPREHRGFFPAQPRHATVPAEGRQSCLLWLEPGAAAGQELVHLGPVVHDSTLRRGPRGEGGAASTWDNSHCRARR